MSDRFQWKPKSVPQKMALDSQADILFYGGAVGALKTETGLMDAVQERNNPNLRAIVFRSSFQEMTDIVDKTRRLYTPFGASYVGSPKWTWTFPAGGTVRFAYMRTDDDVWKYLGPRYSYIFFDESTLHTEKQVRNIMGRLSSTDKSLRLRVRLASNPGNVGAVWHQRIFLRDACPIHSPEQCAEPGKLYHDRTWSDGEPIPFSVAFIPGRMSDHNLLDEDYAKRVAMMEGGSASAMGLGCWCHTEGQYFPFLNKGMIRPLAELDIQWWHNHFITADYGLGKSSAAAGLYVRTPADLSNKIAGVRSTESNQFPQGRIRKIGEINVADAPVQDFARMIVDRFLVPHDGENPRRVVAVYADPANFNADYDLRHGTGGKSISDQMDEVLAPYGLSCEPASNQRVAGWQLVYRMLRSGEFELTDASPKTFEALRTRIHDPDRPGDILKVKGDPLDDQGDETRYALYSWIQPAEVPRELQLKEAVRGLDITSAAVRWQQKSEELDREEAPPRFGSMRMRRRQ